MPIDPKRLDAMVEAGARGLATNRSPIGNPEPNPIDRVDARAVILAALRAAEAWPVPHKLVGREATVGMVDAALDVDDQAYVNLWRAMFDAAPGVGE